MSVSLNQSRNKRQREYRLANRARLLQARRRYYKKNRLKILQRAKELQTPEWRAKRRVYVKNKRHSDAHYKMATALRNRIASLMRKGKQRKHQPSLGLLGCSIESFRLYIESKFEPGMSWSNYGRGGWHIDHIMPCAIFDLSRTEHQKRCFHFSNLQPMWESENLSKRHKITTDQYQLI